VGHLVEMGHLRIAYIANPGSQHADLDRAAGYRAMLARQSLPVDPALIVQADGTMAGGREAARRLLALPRPPTAFFCFNDLTAIGALSVIAESGLKVPEDCSVIGFDDLELAAYSCPPLTTVRQYRDRLGERAMHMLHRLIQGYSDVSPEVLPAELVVRQTTGPAPAPDNGRKEVH
jgi:DNA-binding LacI/PurR family transcriptional regulator